MFRFVILTTLLALAAGAAFPRGMVPIPDGRIVGGEETTIEQFPYQASIRYFWYHRCGGSIVTPTHILTACHCVDGVIMELTTVLGGTSTTHAGGTLLTVDKFIMHEGYNGNTLDNDIAIIIVSKGFAFSEQIQPIGLIGANQVLADGKKAVVSGWGTLAEEGESPYNLQFVELQIISNSKCSAAYQGFYRIADNMMCAGVQNGGKDACQGDSGGPLVVDKQLVGVVSWGIGCARPEFPGVYTSVSKHRSWIDSNM